MDLGAFYQLFKPILEQQAQAGDSRGTADCVEPEAPAGDDEDEDSGTEAVAEPCEPGEEAIEPATLELPTLAEDFALGVVTGVDAESVQTVNAILYIGQ